MKKDRKKALRTVYAVLMLAVLVLCFSGVAVSAALRGGSSGLWGDARKREETVIARLPLKPVLLLPYQAAGRLINSRYNPDTGYLRLADGQIVSGSDSLAPSRAPAHVKELYDVCREEGKDFLYVLCPGKPLSDDDLRLYGISCYRCEGADRLAEDLTARGIPLLDLRPVIREEALRKGDEYALFYKSDHHWTADAGLIAARTIAEELNTRYGTGLDAGRIAEERMEREVEETSFVGEMGQKWMGILGSVDHLVIRRPAEDIVWHYVSPDRKIDQTGGFDIVFDESVRGAGSRIVTGRNRYYYYMGGNDQLGYIENPEAENGSILLIKDSFSCVVTPYLAMTAGRVTWWDMRRDKEVFSYLRAHPEITTVVVMYMPSFAGNSEMNDFR